MGMWDSSDSEADECDKFYENLSNSDEEEVKEMIMSGWFYNGATKQKKWIEEEDRRKDKREEKYVIRKQLKKIRA